MKRAYVRAKNTGQLAPDGSEAMLSFEEVQVKEGAKTNLWNFLVPMIVLIAVTIVYDIDLLKGVVAACIVAILMYLPSKINVL